jgi:hypothetical protein
VQTIQLTGEENITVILSLLQQAADNEILLSVPRGCEALEGNKVNLKLLRRWADNLALHIGLVIEDRATQVLAREAGFVVISSLERGQNSDLRALDRKRRKRKGLPPKPDTGFLLMAAPLSRKRGLGGLSRASVGLVISAVALLALAFLLIFLLPNAVVELTPMSEPAEAAMEITGVAGLAEINYSEAQIPARIVSVDIEAFDTIATTNKRDVPDGYAQGTVVFANKTSIPVTITKGTVLRTSFGENVRFYTLSDAWLPGELFATVQVGILAAESGPVGNVPALTVNVVEGELAAQMDVLNNTRTNGGTVRRISTVDGVDKVNLRAKLSKRLQEEAYRELTSGLGPDDFIPADSLVIEVLGEEFDHKIDEITDELGMTMQVQVSGLVVSGEDGKELLLTLLQQRVKEGYRLLEDSALFERGEVISASLERAEFGMIVQASVVPDIAADSVSTAIAGMTIEAAKEYLSRQFELASEPRIEVTGSFLGRVPWWEARINVKVTPG